MKLVIDTNIVISSIIKDSFTRRLIFNPSIELFSPDYLLEELKNNKAEVTRKGKISEEEFQQFIQTISKIVKIVPKPIYEQYLKSASEVIEDENDWPFAALAIKLSEAECGIWTNDKHFLSKRTELFEKYKITVWRTNELAQVLQ